MRYVKVEQGPKDLSTWYGIKDNFEFSTRQRYMDPKMPWYHTVFEPFWNTLTYENKKCYMKCAIIDINIDTGIQESYDTIWFDLKRYKGNTRAYCQLNKDIWFEIEGDLINILKEK